MSFDLTWSVRLDRSRVERMLYSPGGLVYQDIEHRVDRSVAVAEDLAPGSMGDFITSQMGHEGREVAGYITSGHPATIFVVGGTLPHVIRPVRAQALRFTVGGRVIFAKVVHHPGTDPNDFLTRALRAAL